jgi:hypothetical protein
MFRRTSIDAFPPLYYCAAYADLARHSGLRSLLALANARRTPSASKSAAYTGVRDRKQLAVTRGAMMKDVILISGFE